MPETFNPVTLSNNGGQPLNAAYFNRLEIGVESLDDRAAALELGIHTPVVVSFATSVTLNATQGALFECTATGDLTLDGIVGGVAGQTIEFAVMAQGDTRVLDFTDDIDSVSIPAGTRWRGTFHYRSDGVWELYDSTATSSDGGSTTGGGSTTSGSTETVHVVGNSGTALTLNASPSLGRVKTITLNANCTFTLTGASAGQASTLELLITQDPTGNRRITWPISVRWEQGRPPELSTFPGSVDKLRLTSYDAGTTWRGEMVVRGYNRTGAPLVGWSMPEEPKTVPGVQNEILGRWQARNTWTEVAGALYLEDTELVPYTAAHPGRATDLGIALIPHDLPSNQWNTELDAVIAGTHDADHYAQGQALAALSPATVYARYWWEYNMQNPVTNFTSARFIGAWRRAVPNLRRGFAHDARPGQVLKIVFSPLPDRDDQFSIFYPGDDVVDVISYDVYGKVWSQNNPTVSAMTNEIHQQLKDLAAFGRSRGKPVAISEWGNVSTKVFDGNFDIRGCGDCVEYIDLMFDWASDPANNCLYLCYYNSSEAGVGLDLDDQPLSKVRFTQRAQAVQLSPPDPVPDVPTIGAATASYNALRVAFTPKVTGAPALSYTATASPGGATATGTTSPISVGGLTAGNAYTLTVKANNEAGSSANSAPSNSATVLTPVVYAADNFNRANGSVGTTPTGGFTWTAVGGSGHSWTISSNQLRGVNGGLHVFVVNTGQADGTITATRVSGNAGDGIAFRVVDASNWWYFVPSSFDGSWHLVKQVGGVFSDLMAGDDWVGGETMSVTLSGSLIICKVNGVEQFRRTDTDLMTATKHGVRNLGTSSPQLFDNFEHNSIDT